MREVYQDGNTLTCGTGKHDPSGRHSKSIQCGSSQVQPGARSRSAGPVRQCYPERDIMKEGFKGPLDDVVCAPIAYTKNKSNKSKGKKGQAKRVYFRSIE